MGKILKQITDLKNSEDHCRQIWECVTGQENVRGEEIFGCCQIEGTEVQIERVNSMEYRRICIDNDGTVTYETGEVALPYNPFALVGLLTSLGYAPR
ncbi:hypothetical protein [Persicitalea jodogahamensis]|nr:hypothetical protein [Persicitalea jodogahamensis]